MTFANRFQLFLFAVILVVFCTEPLITRSRFPVWKAEFSTKPSSCCLLYGYLKISLAVGYAKAVMMREAWKHLQQLPFQEMLLRHSGIRRTAWEELQMQILPAADMQKHSHNLILKANKNWFSLIPHTAILHSERRNFYLRGRVDMNKRSDYRGCDHRKQLLLSFPIVFRNSADL